jgi:2-keto-myo-inositol isomerase
LQKKLATGSYGSHNHNTYEELGESALNRCAAGGTLPDFSVNHMSLANASFKSLLTCASQLGCVGVEVRNDLSAMLFDGLVARQAGILAREQGLRILALAEVCAFDDFSEHKLAVAQSLMATAVASGAEAISFIPRNDGQGGSAQERLDTIRQSLARYQPLLEEHGLIGLVEPLGFESCSLRFKSDAVCIIEDLQATHCFKLVHDTFHHHLAGGGPLFAEHTGMVHVSGVVDQTLLVGQMLDEHRVLVDQSDLLENIPQLRELSASGYVGPISFEAFSPDIHTLPDPEDALRGSINFIESGLVVNAA